MNGILKNNKQLIFTVAVAALMVLAFLGPSVNNSLSWNREGIHQLQLWRVVTGHLVHTNLWHGLLNTSALTIAMYLFGSAFSALRWLLYFAILSIFTSLGLFLFNSSLDNYVGLSGVLYGIFALGLLSNIREKVVLHGLVFLGLTAKVIHQQLPGFDPDYLRDSIHATVIVDAHLYGYLCGLGLGLLTLIHSRKKHAKANKNKS